MSTLSKTNTNAEVKALLRDLNKPSLHALSYALRHPETWPEGFIWDFHHCDSCAMGLAHQLWDEVPETSADSGPSIMGRSFAMPFAAAKRIFLGDNSWAPTEKITKGWFWRRQTFNRSDHRAITPEMVADQIDAYLVTAE